MARRGSLRLLRQKSSCIAFDTGPQDTLVVVSETLPRPNRFTSFWVPVVRAFYAIRAAVERNMVAWSRNQGGVGYAIRDALVNRGGLTNHVEL